MYSFLKTCETDGAEFISGYHARSYAVKQFHLIDIHENYTYIFYLFSLEFISCHLIHYRCTCVCVLCR